ncbi:serine hydrolase domain-containing protein [Saccharopolyspora rectivirgula]|uniref:Beta-lactamase n=1 Tax=Saccharopolyspora rectivirgula TaxID=28042 RepID=I0JV91_9PSEU|nr:serine hydrolase domain-containing protein [Saccharopolyspora rectivirgula]KEI43696.1 beta-lactamase [Saccharopolyspora rectivirgula]CCG85358.1 DNA [Saccharopolyspora rectivirgula]
MGRSVLALILLSMTVLTGAASAQPVEHVDGHFDRPQEGFAPPGTVLRLGSAEEAGLDPAPIEAALRKIASWTERTPELDHPMYAGAVSLVAHDGVVVRHEATGYEVRYVDGQGRELPREQWEPMRPDTIFDVASVSKLFTSIAALQQVEAGKIRLDAPVAEYLPEFGNNGKERITVEQLLTHTSGLPAVVQLWKIPEEQRIPFVMQLAPENPPGTHYNYSDPNMITLGLLVERVAGAPLDEVVARGITEPLGMEDTGYNPPREKLHRIAATEYQVDPPRGMVRGEVHDENAWALGGVAGQAGVFSTARDLAVLGQTLLNGGTYRGERILSEESVRLMLTNFNEEFPGNAHGLGFELDQRWYMAGLSSPHTAGHTGYTGTSLVIDPMSRSVVVLLTNRVHPSREWGSNNAARRELAQGLAKSLAVSPARGSASWYADEDEEAVLRTVPLPARGPVRVSFSAFVDTWADAEGTAPLLLEASTDGVHWRPVPVRATGPGAPEGPVEQLAASGHRRWWEVSAEVPAQSGQPVQLRWHYVPDASNPGRGVNLDGILVADRQGVLLDGERESDRLIPQGWVSVSR